MGDKWEVVELVSEGAAIMLGVYIAMVALWIWAPMVLDWLSGRW